MKAATGQMTVAEAELPPVRGRGDFKRGGWRRPKSVSDGQDRIDSAYRRVFGRRPGALQMLAPAP